MRINSGAHFCEGHGHYDVDCPSCVTNRAYDDERGRIIAWLRQQAVLRRGLRELVDAVERGEHLKVEP